MTFYNAASEKKHKTPSPQSSPLPSIHFTIPTSSGQRGASKSRAPAEKPQPQGALVLLPQAEKVIKFTEELIFNPTDPDCHIFRCSQNPHIFFCIHPRLLQELDEPLVDKVSGLMERAKIVSAKKGDQGFVLKGGEVKLKILGEHGDIRLGGRKVATEGKNQLYQLQERYTHKSLSPSC